MLSSVHANTRKFWKYFNNIHFFCPNHWLIYCSYCFSLSIISYNVICNDARDVSTPFIIILCRQFELKKKKKECYILKISIVQPFMSLLDFCFYTHSRVYTANYTTLKWHSVFLSDDHISVKMFYDHHVLLAINSNVFINFYFYKICLSNIMLRYLFLHLLKYANVFQSTIYVCWFLNLHLIPFTCCILACVSRLYKNSSMVLIYLPEKLY